ncbi:MAG: hypothetical protein AAB907_03205, partial [Patescibacteria group bacterium]
MFDKKAEAVYNSLPTNVKRNMELPGYYVALTDDQQEFINSVVYLVNDDHKRSKASMKETLGEL